ncbi:MAG: hypothetical protein IPN99_09315 [Bacteroidetes bacterium]|nr:hypothetical protein [Bacteroidota bacterium]
MYSSSDYGYPDKEGSIGIIGCNFTFNTTLKLPYFGQSAFGIKPKAGVYLRFRHGIIGNNNLTANNFTDLNTGIILKNSSITVNNANFNNIHNEAFYPEAYMAAQFMQKQMPAWIICLLMDITVIQVPSR